MSDSNVQLSNRVTDGPKFATCLNGDENSQKVVPVDSTGTPYSASNPLQTNIAGSLTPGTAVGNLGKAQAGTANSNDVGVALLAKRVDTPATLSATDGQYTWVQVDSQGNVRIAGAVTVSNGVPGVADKTASNFTLGTTQGLAMLAFSDDSSPGSGTEDTAGIVRMTVDRHLRTCAVEETGFVKSVGVNCQVKYASIAASSSGNNTIVAAVTSKKIRVLSCSLSFNGSVNAKWQSGAGGTDLTGLTYGVVNAGFVLPYNPHGWFETAAGVLLNLNLSGATAVGGMLSYLEI